MVYVILGVLLVFELLYKKEIYVYIYNYKFYVFLHMIYSTLQSAFLIHYHVSRASLVALAVKNPPANARDIRDVGSIPGWGRSPGGRHGNSFQFLAWRSSWTVEAGRWLGERVTLCLSLCNVTHYVGSQGVRHNWSNSVTHTSCL